MNKKKIIIISVIALLVLAAVGYMMFGKNSGSQDYTGKRVSVDYVGTHTDGSVFDTSIESVAKEKWLYTPNRPYTPLMFVVGSGQVVPGFERAVQGMKIGQTRKTTIEPKDAYGEYDEKKITTLPKSLFQEANIVAEVGQTYQMGSQLIKVVSLTDTGVNIDGNHPMAGKTLIFDITLKSVE